MRDEKTRVIATLGSFFEILSMEKNMANVAILSTSEGHCKFGMFFMV